MIHLKTLLSGCLALLLFSAVQAQREWSVTGIPHSVARYDDIFFINDSTGWATGGERKIYHTRDGGTTWQLQFTGARYLRSIEFPTPKLGFCGSLDTLLYRTEDGGLNWTEISSSIDPRPAGICGLAAPDALNIYGCGVWRSPAFIIKSTDGGQNWQFIDMSAYATALVDIYFFNKDTGFVAGTANPATDGGIVLYTTNGGQSWQTKFKTQMAEDIIWKIQTPDKENFYASVSSLPTHPPRILRSTNKGASWTSVAVSNGAFNLEMIGFTDRFAGWTGGRNSLFKTTDGGLTWSANLVTDGRGFNRFFKVSDRAVYLSGYAVYKLKTGVQPPPGVEPPIDHSIKVLPNPVAGRGRVELQLITSTFADLALYNAAGRRLSTLVHQNLTAGTKTLPLDLTPYARATYFLVLKTNEGMTHVKVVK